MYTLYKGDCLEVMKCIKDKSIDMVLTDPPYGTTACKWDSVIPFESMWEQLNRIIKDNGAIVLFGSEPFSSYLRMSNIKNYKYDWIWKKSRPTNFFLAKKQPLKDYETISVFYKNQCSYYPKMEKADEDKIDKRKTFNDTKNEYLGGIIKHRTKDSGFRYPKMILEFSSISCGVHPTQKPVALLEYLIKTYTLENETVLDFTMGSGSTCVACVNTNRNFIGIELDDKYFEIAKDRIEKAKESIFEM